jgi:hypothetical protein
VGANWSAYAVNEAEEGRERATFHHFNKLADTNPELIRRTPFVYVASKDLYGQGWYKDLVRNVSVVLNACFDSSIAAWTNLSCRPAGSTGLDGKHSP